MFGQMNNVPARSYDQQGLSVSRRAGRRARRTRSTMQNGRTSPTPLEQIRRRNRVAVSRSSMRGSGGSTRKLGHHDEQLLKKILAKEQDFIDSEAFYVDRAEELIYDEAPAPSPRHPSG